MFVGPLAGVFAGEAIEALRDWKPDLVVGESTDYGSYYAAEHLGVPNAVLDIAPLGPFDEHPATLDQINTQRAALDLDPVTDALHPFRHRRIGIVPECFYPPHARTVSTRYYRPPAPPPPGQLDPALAALPTDRPWVLATLGSNAGRLHEQQRSLLDTIVEVLGELPVTAIVALGRDTDTRAWRGARPDNVHLTSFAPQQQLLGLCEVFLTHAGFSGVREALGNGVPMVALPMFAEQPANATRIAELGAGRRLDVEDVTHRSLHQAVSAVLTDPTYRRQARQVQRDMLALPEFSAAVADLDALVP
nr:glycosyltransferase [Saccharopolyspora sp. HNM0983]